MAAEVDFAVLTVAPGARTMELTREPAGHARRGGQRRGRPLAGPDGLDVRSGDSFTFADVERLTAGYALALQERGVRPGDRVAVMLANEPAFPLTWLALSLLGAVMVPLNTRYQIADAGHVLRACGASAIVAGARFLPLLERVAASCPRCAGSCRPTRSPRQRTRRPAEGRSPARPDPAGTANIQFTSGTTGRPKGCVLSHRYWTQLGGSLVAEFPYLGATT